MATERLTRQINRLLEEAEEAVTELNWRLVRDRAQAVLVLDPDNTDGIALLAAAQRGLSNSGTGLPPPSRSFRLPRVWHAWVGGRSINPRFRNPKFRPEAIRIALATHWDLLILVVILGLALTIRLVRLESIPSNVTADELDNLKTAYFIVEGRGPGWFGLDWKPSPAFSTHLIAGSLQIFGFNIVALRLPSVILSAVALLPFYFLARQVVSKPAALIAALLLATNLWYLHFSRSGWENVYGALYGTSAALCLILALQRRGWELYAATGFFCALGLLGFFSSTFIVAGVFAFLPFALVLEKKRWREVLLGYGLILAVTLLLIAPQLNTLFGDWDYATRRIQNVSVFTIQGDYLGDSSLPEVLTHQFFRNIQGFFLMNTDHYGYWGRYIPADRAFLNFGTSLLFWIGLAASLRYWRQVILWWTMFLAMMIPHFFSTGSPNAAVATPMAPFMYLFVALGIYVSFNLLKRLFVLLRPSIVARVLLTISVLIFFTLMAVSDVRGYFRWIDRPDALQAREPAVQYNQFSDWQRLARRAAKEGRLLGQDEWVRWLEENRE